jgi:hypothetical protein
MKDNSVKIELNIALTMFIMSKKPRIKKMA